MSAAANATPVARLMATAPRPFTLIVLAPVFAFSALNLTPMPAL